MMLNSVTLSVGEERQSKVWRTWAPRWDTYTVEVEAGPVVATLAHKRGVKGLNPDRNFPTMSVGLQKQIGETGPIEWDMRTIAYVDFGSIQGKGQSQWTLAIGIWGRAPLWGPLQVQTATYLRGKPRDPEYRGEQSIFHAELGMGLHWGRNEN